MRHLLSRCTTPLHRHNVQFPSCSSSSPQSISMPAVPGMGRRAVKKDDVRLAHAHITRAVADNLPPGSLADNVVCWGYRGLPGWCLWHGCPPPT